jgi:hypothetical protein
MSGQAPEQVAGYGVGNLPSQSEFNTLMGGFTVIYIAAVVVTKDKIVLGHGVDRNIVGGIVVPASETKLQAVKLLGIYRADCLTCL